MRKTIMRVLVSLAVFAVLVGAYLKGRKDVWINEFKECEANLLTLTELETNHPLELKEYIKARYYHLANRIPQSWVGIPHDYGMVSTNVGHLAVFKGPSSGQFEYEEFLKRFGMKN